MQKTKKLAIALSAMFAFPVAANAAVPTLSEVLDASGISLTGYVDTGYTYINSTGLSTGGTTRVFDAPDAAAGKNFSSFNLHQAAVTLSKQPKEGAGAVINLTAGQDAKVIASSGATPTSQFDVTQAYASYATGPVTAILGKFVTLSGAEVISSTGNSNYSRSILFGYAIPFTHTGARLSYALSDTVNLIGGINNGWDQVSDTNTSKTVELGFTAAPSGMFSLAGAYYGGKEAGALPGTRTLLDLVATIKVGDQLSFVVNYDNASQEDAVTVGSKAKWNGLAAYANYTVNDKWRVSVRGESFNDKDGYRTGLVQKWKEATLTVACMPSKTLEVRTELRTDRSDKLAFLQSDGSGKKNQRSIGMEAIYKF